ncbi:unnamed protein product [Echinostoma caproni]|uniref:MAP1 n=1 Tax=Echinostoma caproni TaxID=27848 RepID=A0A183AS41_9TREM|nr:unnamed protein product [Echinostoma caproni]
MAETEQAPATKPEGTAPETKPKASAEPEAEKKEATTEQPSEKPAVPQYRSIVLGSFGGSKHLRSELTDQRKPDKNEVEVEVEAW